MTTQPSRVRRHAALMSLLLISSLAIALPAVASHSLDSLPGSNFEIDTNANLKVDDAGKLDWAGLTPFPRVQDQPSGSSDDSYKGGAKEDDPCPGISTGSIPPNKSDLLNFGTHVEPGSGSHPGFLHLYWHRVQEPSGTTLMDFEFNQSDEDCGNGVNRVRTNGDMLLEYRLDGGGSKATIVLRRWTDSAWGPASDISSSNLATGTINSSAIAAADSGGLGPISPRTFGEASIDLSVIFDEDRCTSFGSAMLKSRSSTSFTSALKDFIAPAPISLTNCGRVEIRKSTDVATTDQFGFTKSFGTDPATNNTFQLTDGGVETFNNVLLGSGYTVTEDVLPANWGFDRVDCTASSGVTPTIVGATVTFDIDSVTDVLKCTYHNERLTGSLVVHKVKGTDGSPLTGAGFTLTSGPGTPIVMNEEATGVFCAENLQFGTYTATESMVPDGYNGGAPQGGLEVDSASDCSDATDPDRTPDATFVNNPAPGTITIAKTDDAGPPANALNGAGFTLYEDVGVEGTYEPDDDTTVAKPEVLTDNGGSAQFTEVPLGKYCVVETTTPSGYATADPQCVTIGLGATPGTGQTINLTFVDPRNHKVIVIVCHEGTNTLLGSTVTDDGGNGTSLQTLASSVDEQALCSLDGFTGKPHGTEDYEVSIPTHAN